MYWTHRVCALLGLDRGRAYTFADVHWRFIRYIAASGLRFGNVCVEPSIQSNVDSDANRNQLAVLHSICTALDVDSVSRPSFIPALIKSMRPSLGLNASETQPMSIDTYHK